MTSWPATGYSASSTTGGELTWKMWNNESTGAITTSSTDYTYRTGKTIWKNWHTAIDITHTTSSEILWSKWVDQTHTSIPTTYHYEDVSGTAWLRWNENLELILIEEDDVDAIEVPAEMPAGIQRELEESNARLRKEAEAAQAERQKAEQKAKDLLMELIGEEKREEYERTGRIFFHGEKHDYIVRDYGHVKQIEHSGHIQELCVHIDGCGMYPDADNVVALLLAFQFDEQATIKKANKHGRMHFSKYDAKDLQAAGMPENYFKNLKEQQRRKLALPTLREENRDQPAERSDELRRAQPPAANQRSGPT